MFRTTHMIYNIKKYVHNCSNAFACLCMNKQKKKKREKEKWQRLASRSWSNTVGSTNEKWAYRIIAKPTHEISSDKIYWIDILWWNVSIPFTKVVLKDEKVYAAGSDRRRTAFTQSKPSSSGNTLLLWCNPPAMYISPGNAKCKRQYKVREADLPSRCRCFCLRMISPR